MKEKEKKEIKSALDLKYGESFILYSNIIDPFKGSVSYLVTRIDTGWIYKHMVGGGMIFVPFPTQEEKNNILLHG